MHLGKRTLLALHTWGVKLWCYVAVPYYPGGSLYARNPPVQKEVSIVCKRLLLKLTNTCSVDVRCFKADESISLLLGCL